MRSYHNGLDLPKARIPHRSVNAAGQVVMRRKLQPLERPGFFADLPPAWWASRHARPGLIYATPSD